MKWLWPTSGVGRGAVVAMAWGITATMLALQDQTRGTPPPAGRPVAAADRGYVTSDQCRSCHPGQYASWHASFHRTMTQVATPETVIPELDGLSLALDGWTYRITRENESFVVRRQQDGSTTTPNEPPRRIALTTGSHHQQNFWMETGDGRTVEPFPFGWMIAEKRWAPVPDTFLCPPEVRNGRAEGAWNNGCISCHATAGRPRLGLDDKQQAFDSRVAEFGIACEGCHGEGREHVERNRNPVTRFRAHLTAVDDPAITNPAKLSGRASALVCGQCHSIWAFETAADWATWNRDGAAYRPGDSTLSGRFVAQPGTVDHAKQKQALREANPHFFEDSYWPDGMIRVTGREYNGLELSPCFRGGEFSCLSCHSMHPPSTEDATLVNWRVSQMQPGVETDHACLQCHAAIAADPAAHTHHAPDSAGSSCSNCHMPHSGFGLLRAVRSHQISSPTAAESHDVGRPNACNLCHLDQTLAWTADRLRTWYNQPAPELTDDERTIAAGALWALRGDAGQRALVAWSMGWAPARQAARGRDWFAPYLAITLNDPYAAVRYVAWQSLRTLPGFEDQKFNYTDPDDATFAAAMRAYERTVQLRVGHTATPNPAVLLDATGRFSPATYNRLLDQRDNRRIYLVE